MPADDHGADDRRRRYWDKHSASYDKQMGFFDRHLFGDSRAWVCSGAVGRTLEVGTGTDVAIQASDLTLMRGGLDGVPAAILLSRRTYRTIWQNLLWAFGYNTAAIPLAALGLLSPVIAGAAMRLSSVSVVANSLRLLRFHGDPLPQAPGHRGLPAHRAGAPE